MTVPVNGHAGDVFCLSHLRWSFVYQRPNHLMSRCARERRVFFVEEPMFHDGAPRLAMHEAEPNLVVVVPHLPHGAPAHDGEREVSRLFEELVRSARVRDPIVWMYTPMAITLARTLPRAVTVYDCMDELTGFRGAPPILRERERELFSIADLVFTGGHSLYEAKREHHPRVHAFPSSVDAMHFAKARGHLPRTEPEDQRHLPRPRLGFFGVVDERMDLTLLRELAELRPDFQLVVIGPVVKIDPAQLPRLPNIHYLGKKSYDELPAYVAGWDLAIMPFALNEATRYISPTKTLEYLAAGKSVVSTPVHDVVKPYGERGLVRIARTAAEFAAAAQAALDEQGTPAGIGRRARCDEYVAGTSWDRTWAQMHSLVHQIHDQRKREKETESVPCSTT